MVILWCQQTVLTVRQIVGDDKHTTYFTQFATWRLYEVFFDKIPKPGRMFYGADDECASMRSAAQKVDIKNQFFMIIFKVRTSYEFLAQFSNTIALSVSAKPRFHRPRVPLRSVSINFTSDICDVDNDALPVFH